MNNLWQEWNWAGIGFCSAVVLFMPVCGAVGWWLKRPSRAERSARMVQADFQARWNTKASDPKGTRADYGSTFQVAPTPKHVHILDMDRGDIRISDTGGVHARCAVAGCEEPVYIAPNLARLHVGQEVER